MDSAFALSSGGGEAVDAVGMYRNIIDTVLAAETPEARRQAAHRIAAMALAALVSEDGRASAETVAKKLIETVHD